jgi:hypothetical protein
MPASENRVRRFEWIEISQNVYVLQRLNSGSARIRTKKRQVLDPRAFHLWFVLAKFRNNVFRARILPTAVTGKRLSQPFAGVMPAPTSAVPAAGGSTPPPPSDP